MTVKSIRSANKKVQAWDKYIRKTVRPLGGNVQPLGRYWLWVRREVVRMHQWERVHREYRRKLKRKTS
jgi:hypothetical protein